nr:MAB_1171c family putative transporter [Streptomyces sp. S1D4-11]QIZ00303.1 hypothetical protein HEP87_48925 [Streptomyces sp. S1D4-11]
MNASRYYIPALALWAGLGVKLPDLIRTWRDPLVRSVCWVIFLGGAGFLFAAPPTVAAVNRASGIPNLAAPLDYVIVSAYSAACLLLILHWRGGPADHVRRLARRWQIGYIVLITLILFLFVAGDAPVERRTDLDTYYATTPWIGQMIALYLLGHITAAVATTALCRRWALEVRGWLRAGLWLLVAGWLLNLSFSTLKLTAVAARWAGGDWDVLSTSLAPGMASLAATVATVGFTVPLLGPRLGVLWHTVMTCRRLGPLWRELGGASPGSPLAAPIPWYSSYAVRLTRREVSHPGRAEPPSPASRRPGPRPGAGSGSVRGTRRRGRLPHRPRRDDRSRRSGPARRRARRTRRTRPLRGPHGARRLDGRGACVAYVPHRRGGPRGRCGRRGPCSRKNPVMSPHDVPPRRPVPPPDPPRRATAPSPPSDRPSPRTSPEGRQAQWTAASSSTYQALFSWSSRD